MKGVHQTSETHQGNSNIVNWQGYNRNPLEASIKSQIDGILLVDNLGKIVHWNQEFADMWQIPEEMLNTSYDNHLLKHILGQLRNPEDLLSHVKSLLKSSEKQCGTLFLLDDRVFEYFSSPILSKKSAAERMWYFRDITAPLHAEQSLLQSIIFTDNIINSIDDPIFVKDEKHRWVILNNTACMLMGAPREKLIGKSDHDLFPKEQADVFLEIDKRVLREGVTNVYEDEITRHGVQHTISTKKSLFHDPMTDKKYVVGTMRDITDRKRGEADLKRKLEFEKLITTISSNFINLSIEEIDPAIKASLRAAAEFEELDSGCICIFEEKTQVSDCIYEWCSPGSRSFCSLMSGENLNEKLPSIMSFILSRQIIQVPRINSLQAEILDEKQFFRRHGVKSAIMLPLIIGGRVVGFLCFTTRRSEKEWGRDWISLYKILADILSNALARKKNEEHLLKSEERYRRMFEDAHVGVFQTSLDGKALSVNQAYARLFGYDTPQEFINSVENIADDVYANSLDRRKVIDLISRSDGPINIEIDLRRKDNSTFMSNLHIWTVNNAANQPLYIEGFVEDITDRKEAERKLQESEKRYRSILENTIDFIYTIKPDGTITYASPQMAHYGFTEDEEIGRNIKDYIYPDDLEHVTASMQQAMQTDGEYNHELRILGKNGKLYYIEDTGRVVFDGDEVVQLTGVIRDITDRKEAERKLQESENRYRNILENTIDFIYTIRPDGTITYASPQVAHYGYSAEEEIGKNIKDYIHPDDIDRVLADMQQAIQASGEYCHELRISGKDGKLYYIENTGRVIFDGDEVVELTGVVRDISDRKVAERKLRESEERYRSIIENTTDLIYVYDTEGKVTFISPQVSQYGYSPEDVVGHNMREFIHPDDIERAMLDKQRVLVTGEEFPTELRLLDSQGDEIYVEEIGKRMINAEGDVYVIGVIRNVTDRKLAEIELRKSEMRFQELFNTAMEGIGLVDANEIIQFCNPAFAAIFDAESVADMIDRNLLDFTVPSQRDMIKAETEKRKMGKKSKYEVDIFTTKGNTKTILASTTPKFDENGNYVGALGNAMDITETKRLQEFTSRAMRLETAGRIAGQVAHDFNNLLGPLTAYPELIKEDLPSDHPALELLEDIQKAAGQIAEINQQLLTLGRRGHYNLETVNLNEVVAQVLDQFNPLPANLQVINEPCPDLVNIKGGSSQILRIIMNLISNAVDAMPEGGQIHIKTENFVLVSNYGKFIKIPKGEYVKLTISDSGIGMAPDVLPRIFDPFFTTKSADKKRGSGLGLSVVHAVVEDHYGYIDWNSKLGKGTAFYLYFPKTTKISSESSPANIVGGNENILVVDDDQIQRGVTQNLLEKLGYRVNMAKSGEEAIVRLKENSYDLMIVDMIMPAGMDGAETCQAALELNPDQKMIIVSGYAESDRVAKSINCGAGAFIRKPLTLKSIAQAVRQELDRNKKGDSAAVESDE